MARLGIYASRVWARAAFALFTSDSASLTSLELRCARSTTVFSETCADASVGATASIAAAKAAIHGVRNLFPNVTSSTLVKTSNPARAGNHERVPEPLPAHASR